MAHCPLPEKTGTNTFSVGTCAYPLNRPTGWAVTPRLASVRIALHCRVHHMEWAS